MTALRLEIALPLRTFHLELALDVARETVALVGPSGAGKTTVLHAIAGLARPASGRIAIDDEVVFDDEQRIFVPPEERRVGLVFQEYALFPHMSVADNVAYGGSSRRSAELLERFQIAHLSSAKPGRLSGGERQRVALARAIARDPAVLLLDEPLSALDAHTRAEVRAELQELLHELALPTVLVTHDFEDAAALADRVGVIVDGRILQLGTPRELLAAPSSPFVASFTGGNLIPGVAGPGPDGLTRIELDDGTVVLSTDAGSGRVGVIVQPWEISLTRASFDESALNHLPGRVTSIVPLGNRVRVRIGPFVSEITASSAERLELRVGDSAIAAFKATATKLVPLA